MIKEEDILLRKYGNKNHFITPDGYFDNLSDRLMAQLPESNPCMGMNGMEPRKGVKVLRIIAKYAVAACVAGAAVVGGVALLQKQDANGSEVMANKQPAVHSEYSSFDEAADYVMLDNQDIYASLVAESSNK